MIAAATDTSIRLPIDAPNTSGKIRTPDAPLPDNRTTRAKAQKVIWSIQIKFGLERGRNRHCFNA
jgi:hypothetical protein